MLATLIPGKFGKEMQPGRDDNYVIIFPSAGGCARQFLCSSAKHDSPPPNAPELARIKLDNNRLMVDINGIVGGLRLSPAFIYFFGSGS